MKAIESLGMSLIHCPSFACIQKCGENDCTVHLQFCVLTDALSVPDVMPQSSKSCTGLCNS